MRARCSCYNGHSLWDRQFRCFACLDGSFEKTNYGYTSIDKITFRPQNYQILKKYNWNKQHFEFY
jgi:hypothetical protein